MTTPVTFMDMLRRLLRADEQGRAAKTVEIYGWVVLIEGATCMIWPHLVATVLGIPPLEGQGVGYFRLAGVWVAGIGLLYVLSGRLNATGFVFPRCWTVRSSCPSSASSGISGWSREHLHWPPGCKIS